MPNQSVDSKDLKLHQREALFASLREAKKVSVGYVTRILTAEELSGRMLDLYESGWPVEDEHWVNDPNGHHLFDSWNSAIFAVFFWKVHVFLFAWV